ncbi:MAG TPA: molybdopterin-dependent oxidoreductase [Planctomycetaceae bacterium]|nr:molybdopterin-dependent oxidoreductase [Planctomycetaceae bacterium]
MRLLVPRRPVAQSGAFALIVSLAIPSARAASADDKPHEAVLVLQGTTGELIRLTQGEFKKLPHIEVEAVDHRGNKARYSGVPLRALLDKIGVPNGEKLRGEWIGSFVAVDALDDYRAVFGLAELDPAFNDRTIILADLRNGQPLDKRHGPFQVIAPGEKRQARWVWGVREIRVVDSRAKEK